ncbi:asparagine synthase C-terminal domain-containing protein [Balneolales bacterium ANBcel1]|nr:asparagine synthase C-terminal domain-containing protein [Balneolales bacterium ANBcel1]
MKVHIILDDSARWNHETGQQPQSRVWCRSEGGRDSGLTGKVRRIADDDEAADLCNGLKGRFAWIREMQDIQHPGAKAQVRIAVDFHRSIPLFYAINGRDVYIGDQPDLIRRSLPGSEPDRGTASEYLVLGYLTGSDTLFRGIKQVEAGSIVTITDGDDGPAAETTGYFTYRHHYRNADRNTLLKDLDDVALQTMQRSIDHADGRPVILPLSGGHDSRLIALLLHRLNYRDVICYSYGKQGSPEMKLSREIAEALGYRWIGVPYTRKKWRDWFNRPERKRYYKKAARPAGIPNIQEWVAVGELRSGGTVPDDSLFMSGHFGDALVGGKGIYDTYTYREHPETHPDTILRHIFHYHYYLWDWSAYRDVLEPFFRDRILRLLQPIDAYPDSPSACEAWNIRERQSKFIINSGRIYDFFGYDWLMPYCDPDYMRFWLEIPLAFRHDKNLYTSYIDRLSPFNTPTHNPGKAIIAVRETIRKTPLFRPSRALYNKWAARRRRKKEYETHPMAWYGMMRETDFRKLYTGSENINSFQSLELLRTIFENGYLSVDDILHQSYKALARSPLKQPDGERPSDDSRIPS